MASRVVPLDVTSFLKASPMNLLWPVACSSFGRRGVRRSCRRRAPGEVLSCACVCICSTAMGCPAALDLAGVVTSGCFAANAFFIDGCFAVVVAGPSLADALLRIGRPPLQMFCRRGCLLPRRMLGHLWIPGRCFAALDSLAPSLVDALLPRVCWPVSLRMLCRCGRSVHWRMLCRHSCWLLVLSVDALPPRLGL
jgi:hypothetical protein